MNRFALIYTFLFVSVSAFSQNVAKDTVLLKNGSSLTAFTHLKPKQYIVHLKGARVRKLKFEEIESIRSGDGYSYINKTFEGKEELVLQLVNGHHDLFYQEKKHRFIVGSKDSLRLISKKYFVSTADLIFGKNLVSEFEKSSDLLPAYSEKYLAGLVNYANRSKGLPSVIFKSNIRRMRYKPDIGLIAGAGLMSSGFTDWFHEWDGGGTANSVQSNISGSIGLTFGRFVRVGFNGGYTTTEMTGNQDPGVLGFVRVGDTNYERRLIMERARLKTVILEPHVNFYFLNRFPGRWSPYVQGGVVALVRAKAEMDFHIRYNGVEETTYYRETKEVGFKKKTPGFSAGLGLNYKVSRKISLDLNLKNVWLTYADAIFGKASVTENNTPVSAEKIYIGMRDRVHIQTRTIGLNISAHYNFR